MCVGNHTVNNIVGINQEMNALVHDLVFPMISMVLDPVNQFLVGHLAGGFSVMPPPPPPPPVIQQDDVNLCLV